ncbi:hypothetical protein [Streptomyces sp. NP-1717]|uniref:hypothetical protein n=1 Tax=Streptomyces sp. NP-1717 TaxID=2704470 RepID=UPI001F5C7AA1|nr:hypothetical protein [Streptomyces sp. NP-1717]
MDQQHPNPVPPEPAGAMTQMRHLTAEVEKIAAEAGVGARRAQRRGKFWNATHLMLGFPAAVLAAVSGAAGLTSPDARVPAAILALLAAGFSSGAAFLRAEARQLANLRRRYAWQEVEVRARLVLAREAYMTEEDLYQALSRLLEQRRAVPSSAIVLSELPAPPTQPEPPQIG